MSIEEYMKECMEEYLEEFSTAKCRDGDTVNFRIILKKTLILF